MTDKESLPPHFLQSNPDLYSLNSLPFRIARYLHARLEYDQPALCLGAALAVTAALKSARITSPFGIEPNLYCCLIASSGSGKSQIQRALSQLLLKAGLRNLLMGKPASEAGLLKGLAETPRRLLIWDEFGVALSELAGNRVASYRAHILGTLTDLHSAAGTSYIGKEYADRPVADISSPHLSILAASTPNRFFSSLSENFIEDGFLARWLVWFAEDTTEPPVCLPEEEEPILAAIKALEDGKPRAQGGNLEVALKPALTPYSFNGIKPVKHWKEDFRGLLSMAVTDSERVLWSRAFEQWVKVCFLISDTPEVNYECQLVAAEIVQNAIKNLICRCQDHLGLNEKQKAQKKFLALLEVGETITLADLARRAQRLPLTRRERQDLLADAIERFDWQAAKVNIKGAQRPTTLITRVR